VYRGLANAYSSYMEEKVQRMVPVVDLAAIIEDPEGMGMDDFWETIPDMHNNIEEYVETKLRLEEFFADIRIWERDVILLLADGYKQSEIEDMLGLPRPYIWRVKRKLDAFLEQ
ncbi:MAG: hypothetical protein J6J03_02385, partial [Tyzzerella sp.]|nr:hypothetical protein [Tyzzerella sp.]